MRLTTLVALLAHAAALREGLFVKTLAPAGTPIDDLTIAYVQGGPTQPTSYLFEEELQALADRDRRPVVFFDFCGLGRSTCAAAKDWDEHRAQAAEFLTHVKATVGAARTIATLYSAGAMSTPESVLRDVKAVVYLSPSVSLYATLATRRRCVREYLDVLVSVLPYRVVDNLGYLLCTPLPKMESFFTLRAFEQAIRSTVQRERIIEGYRTAVLQPPYGARPECLFVVYGEHDRVVDPASTVAMHARASGRADTLAVVPGGGHVLVEDGCAHCAELVAAYDLAAARC
jgi:pimeloyl-ACP methyl ester carboxylesterase